MQASAVINLATWTTAFGAAVGVASAYTAGPLSGALNTLALVINSMTLGALLTHHPGMPTSAAHDGPRTRPEP